MNCALPATGANGGNEPIPPTAAGPNAHADVGLPQQRAAITEPLNIQELEAALDMGPFMAYAREILSQPLSSDDGSAEDAPQLAKGPSGSRENGTRRRKRRSQRFGSKEERQAVKTQIYNFSELTADREWLYETLLSDTASDTEISDEDDYIKELLKTHVREQKHRANFYKKPTNSQFAYYASGLLSSHDMFPEHQQSIVGVRRRKRRTLKEKPPKMPKLPKGPRGRRPRNHTFDQREPGEVAPSQLNNYTFGDTSAIADDDEEDDNITDELESTAGGGGSVGGPLDNSIPGVPGQAYSGRGRRRRSQVRTPAAMAARRRRVWQLMAKKELGRGQRAKVKNHNDALQNCKRVASMCMKVVRQRAMISQKVMKETVWRAKRLTREMLGYWKRYERVERDTRRRMEKEAEEQRKMDVEIIEAKRQQRKLNFLITQTELYAHFMSKKLGQGTEEEQLRILNQLDEEVNPRLAAYDDYDADHMKVLAQRNAEDACDTDRAKMRQFDLVAQMKIEAANRNAAVEQPLIKQEMDAKADLPQPAIFQGTLKTYQIKGMTWLANIYDQGISGILADEMGLGKTVQSIAFLCHIAERYGVWGPFLVISPASTLHNWQQEMQRFVPAFNVVPYWGSPNERKILRQFWEQKDLHTRDASFHVVITSYQLIVSDYKYFNRIKWQYMILDEAQAIKSSSSMRWKLLLGFNCRNRLLLSGTPIQNSMAELWALLHFIMPTLFDSHDEFNEWFSKDIESHAENKTGIDERQISRLHMILKPFMLRRIKKDVENELSDKIEIMVYCPLTIRQKLLYMALKKKIRIEDLLHLTRGGGGPGNSAGDGHNADRNFTSNLMNLVMQFRKVCNHPELFERRDVRSPFAMRCEEYVLPRLLYDEALLYKSIPSKRHLLYNQFSIFKAEHIQRSLFRERQRKQDLRKRSELYARYVDLNASDDCCFSFARLSDLSPKDLEDVTIGGLISQFLHYRQFMAFARLMAYRRYWWPLAPCKRSLLLEPMLERPLARAAMAEYSVLQEFLFTRRTVGESSVYAFGDYTTANMQETIEHRVIRSKNQTRLQALYNDPEYVRAAIKTELDVDIDGEDSQMALPPAKLASQAEKKGKANAVAYLVPEFEHVSRQPTCFAGEPLKMPQFLYGLTHRVQATKRRLYCESRAAEWAFVRHTQCENSVGLELVSDGLEKCRPHCGWATITIPDKQTLVSDAGKLAVLDSLLTRLKAQGHRVLIYSQMTKMIDLLEEYMWHRKHRYMRLDGSSKISARRDMVADFQSRADIFVFLLSTRAGGLGINLTAADTIMQMLPLPKSYGPKRKLTPSQRLLNSKRPTMRSANAIANERLIAKTSQLLALKELPDLMKSDISLISKSASLLLGDNTGRFKASDMNFFGSQLPLVPIEKKIEHQLRLAVVEGGSTNPKLNIKLRRVLKSANENDIDQEHIQSVLQRCAEPEMKANTYLLQLRYQRKVYVLCSVHTDNVRALQRRLTPIMFRHGAYFAYAMHLFDSVGLVDAVKSYAPSVPFEYDLNMESTISRDATAVKADCVEVIDYGTASVQFKCHPNDMFDMCGRIAEHGYKVLHREFMFTPKKPVQLNWQEREGYKEFVRKLRKLPDVEYIYDNVDKSEPGED